MSLQTDLDQFKTTWMQRVGGETAAVVAADIEALAALATNAKREGAAFPALTLSDQNGRPVDLGRLMSESPLVVSFYRGGWCPYCNLELRAYQKALPEITELGARLVAVSPETPDNALSTAEKNDLAFTVLSDDGGRLADALGIRFELSPAVKALYQKFGHDLASHNGDGRWSLPMPATYVVDRGGVIARANVDPDYRRRMDPADAIAALRKLKNGHAA